MKIFDKLRHLVRLRGKTTVLFTQQQISDMDYWARHCWPTPPESFVAGETVWFLDKGRIPMRGTVAKLRKVVTGNPYYVVRVGDDPSRSRTFHVGEPMFRNREDLLLYHIGEQWRTISRLYKNLEQATENVDHVQHYTSHRIQDCKTEIEFLENQLVLRSPDELDWEASENKCQVFGDTCSHNGWCDECPRVTEN